MNKKVFGGKAKGLAFIESQNLAVPAWYEINPKNFKWSTEWMKTHFGSNWHYKKYAVRSSALNEDGIERSYAGIFHTILEVHSSEIPHAIEKCLESLDDPRVREYVQQETITLYLIIQEMIEPLVAGVFFTCHPQLKPGELILEAARGLGEQVVAGTVEVERHLYYRLQKEWSIEQLNEKIPIMKDEWRNLILEGSLKLETYQKNFMDIEWAIDRNEKLWFLQARPITNLPKTTLTILDNSNIGENYPGITLPLSVAILKQAYANSFNYLLKRLRFPDDFIKNAQTQIHQMVVAVKGRTYYRMENWLCVIGSVPLIGNMLMKSFQTMIGSSLSLSSFNLKLIKMTPTQAISVLGEFIFLFLRRRDEKLKYRKRVQEIFKNLEIGLSQISLLEKKHQQLFYWSEEFSKISAFAFFNDLLCSVFYHYLRSNLPGQTSQDKGAYLHHLIDGSGELASSRGLKWAQKISKSMSTQEKEEILKLKNHEMGLEWLLTLNLERQMEIKDYLIEYGDRVPEEMKFEVKSFNERCHEFLQMLIGLPDHFENNQDKKNFPPLSFLQSWVAKVYLESISFREESRLMRLRMKGYFRRYILSFDEELFLHSKINKKNDVFYFNFDQFAKDILGHDVITPHPFEPFSGSIWDQVLCFMGHEERAFKRTILLSSALQGIGCSGGEITGEVLILESPDLKVDVQNKILVAPATDPGWMMLILKAKGLIIERGNLLSHTAIIGRELNIPAIVGVKSAISHLKNGQTIWMSGITGEIKIIKE
jgi:phosphohistidine swiveling domain-containing protein